MNNHENKNYQTDPDGFCPCCPRHCPLDATSCERGAAYAAMSPEERAAAREAHSHGERDGRTHGERDSHAHGDHGERDGHVHGDYDGHAHGERDGHGHGERGERGHDRREEDGHHRHHDEGCDRDCGPHRHGPDDPEHRGREPHRHGPDGPGHRGPHPELLDDPDSLNGLMHRCGHALRHRADRDRGQRTVLALLAAWGETDQRALQNALAIQPGSVSELLSKLEAKGYIVKTRSEQDRRMATVALTEEGKAAARSLPEKKQDLYAALTPEEQETLKNLLKKLLESWE